MEESVHGHGYLLTIGYWVNLQPLSPPQRLGQLGLNGQEAWVKTKNIREMHFHLNDQFVFLINHSITIYISVLVGFFQKYGKPLCPHTRQAGMVGWEWGQGQPWGPTFNPWRMETGTDVPMLLCLWGSSLRAMFHSIPLRIKLPSSTGFILYLLLITLLLVYSYPHPHGSVSKIFQKATKYFHSSLYVNVCPWGKHKLRYRLQCVQEKWLLRACDWSTDSNSWEGAEEKESCQYIRWQWKCSSLSPVQPHGM